MKSLRKLGVILLVLVMVVSMTACSKTDDPGTEQNYDDWDKVLAAAKEEGEVVVYSNFPQDIEIEIFKAFTEETGIKVTYNKIGGSVPTMQKYMTEAENGQNVVDLIQMSELTAKTIEEAGYLAKLPESMPNLKNLSADFPATEYFAPTVVEALVLVYNTEMITPEELPNTYEELADPKYKDKVIMGSPENSANTIKFIQGCKELYGEDFLQKLAEINIMEVDKEVTAADLVGKGERPFALMVETAASTAIKSGAPLGYKSMEQTFTGLNGVILPYKAPHPNAARVLANWMLGETHQNLFVSELNAIVTIDGANTPAGIKPLDELGPYAPDQKIIQEKSTELMTEWREAMDAK